VDDDVSGMQRARRLAYSIVPGVLLAGIAGGIAFPVIPLLGVGLTAQKGPQDSA
jgi:hypothetical protein